MGCELQHALDHHTSTMHIDGDEYRGAYEKEGGA